MSKVAFLGLGAMGSRMATNLLRAGHELTVWNLTPEPTKTLVASGAKPATTPREAAEGNEFIVTMVTNDVASRQVWLDAVDGALLGMRPGAIAIDSSTLTPAWVRELARERKTGAKDRHCNAGGMLPQGTKDRNEGQALQRR
jgi:3-hydroxyisobutyrate dehydrogenase